MPFETDDFEVEEPASSHRPAGLLPSWVVNVWIGFVLFWFIVVRILGSATGRHILSVLGLRHGE